MRRTSAMVFMLCVVVLGAVPSHAVHFYRGPGGGCTPTDGPTTDDPPETAPDVTATVALFHNTFNDMSSGTPVTRIGVGESVRWEWWSSHCHSTESDENFNSGFHYPTAEPESTAAVPGAFHFPVLDDTPTLSFVHTFTAAGTFSYFCVHHAAIGMRGVVIVE